MSFLNHCCHLIFRFYFFHLWGSEPLLWVSRQAQFICYSSSVSGLWHMNILLRPTEKWFGSQHFSSCCWTVVKKNMTVSLTLSWLCLVCGALRDSQARLVQVRMEQTWWVERGRAPEGFCDEGVCVQWRISVSSKIWKPAERNLKWPWIACLLRMGKHSVSVYLCVCVS